MWERTAVGAKNQTGPNSLADYFDLRPGKGDLSPLVENFLDSSKPGTNGTLTRRQYIRKDWSTSAVTNIQSGQQENLEKLGSMPTCKYDTIKLVNNRIALLSALREQFLQFDGELLDLLRKSWTASIASAPAKLTCL